MENDISALEPLLENGDRSILIPGQGVSYNEKLGGIPPRRSAASYFNLWNRLGYGMACFPLNTTKEKSTMTEATRSPVPKKIWYLLLILLTTVLIIASIYITFFIGHPQSQPAQAEVEAILVKPKELNVATLLKVQSQEPPWGAMRNCLDKAVQKFSEEPEVLKKNAKMVLQCNGTRQEFQSGKGENVIEVAWINDRVDYLIQKESIEVHVARLSSRPWPLNLTIITGVRRELSAFEEIQGCLNEVVREFPREPLIVQNNAKLVVSCGTDLTFISGEGKTEISVYRENNKDGKIQYSVKATGEVKWARFFTRGSI
ncbi:uncharacterized protein LOC129329448 [Eublepharis macularius]|uniref:Uncharacterized protein LOC129329448 n=1 Tax=Eublepharis macularius TaxID=481883 RepID=A0AA97JC77_EUBMA|nr:uncharacterized protein LOC129329448 [Eublepharis macularius]